MEVNRKNSYAPLRSVLLACPTLTAFDGLSDPRDAYFTAIPDPQKVQWELVQYRALLQKLGIAVYHFYYWTYPNQIFLADLAFAIDDRIILGRPKHAIRRGEEDVLMEELRGLGVYNCWSFRRDDPEKTLEAADVLLTDNRITCAIGGRTTVDAVVSLSKANGRAIGNRMIYTTQALAEGIPQHLLGHKHILGPSLLLSRTELSEDDLWFENVISVRETEEVVEGFAMNIVVVKKGVIIMPEGCPETRRLYEKAGLTCLTTPMSEIHKMGGGLACLTLELFRG